jgi:periplasmic copper chaperone A
VKCIHLLASVLTLSLALGVGAQDLKTLPITVQQPHARPSLAGQTSGVAYMTLLSVQGDQLLSATTPAARSVELHTMAMHGEVMQMRELHSLELPAGQTVALKPSGHHFMLMGLVAPLKEGSTLSMQLKFARAGFVTVQVPVKKLN